MNHRRLVLAILLSLCCLLLFPRIAQAQCYNALGAPVACPGEKDKKHRAAPTLMPTPLPTPAPTATSAGEAVVPLLPPVGGATGAGDAGNPALPQVGPSQSPYLLPGLLGLIIIVAIIGVIFVRRRTKIRTVAGTMQHELGHNLGLSHDPGGDSFNPGEIDINKSSAWNFSKKHDDAPTVYPAFPREDSLTFKQSVQADNTGNPRDGDDSDGLDSPWEQSGRVDWNANGQAQPSGDPSVNPDPP